MVAEDRGAAAEPRTPEPLKTESLALLDWALGRMKLRLAGLGDAEWNWTPVTRPQVDEDGIPEISIRWRLGHLATAFGAERCQTWLGLPARPEPDGQANSAEEALTTVFATLERFRADAASLDEEAWRAPIGPVGDWFAEHSRAAFVLHMADELIHHSAEAALLRDLWADQQGLPATWGSEA